MKTSKSKVLWIAIFCFINALCSESQCAEEQFEVQTAIGESLRTAYTAVENSLTQERQRVANLTDLLAASQESQNLLREEIKTLRNQLNEECIANALINLGLPRIVFPINFPHPTVDEITIKANTGQPLCISEPSLYQIKNTVDLKKNFGISRETNTIFFACVDAMIYLKGIEISEPNIDQIDFVASIIHLFSINMLKPSLSEIKATIYLSRLI